MADEDEYAPPTEYEEFRDPYTGQFDYGRDAITGAPSRYPPAPRWVAVRIDNYPSDDVAPPPTTATTTVTPRPSVPRPRLPRPRLQRPRLPRSRIPRPRHPRRFPLSSIDPLLSTPPAPSAFFLPPPAFVLPPPAPLAPPAPPPTIPPPTAGPIQPAAQPHYFGDWTFVANATIPNLQQQFQQYLGSITPAEQQAITALAVPLNNLKLDGVKRRPEVYGSYVAEILEMVVAEPVRLANVTSIFFVDANYAGNRQHPKWLNLQFTRRPGLVHRDGRNNIVWDVVVFPDAQRPLLDPNRTLSAPLAFLRTRVFYLPV